MLASKFDQFFNFTSHFAKGEKVIQIFSTKFSINYFLWKSTQGFNPDEFKK